MRRFMKKQSRPPIRWRLGTGGLGGGENKTLPENQLLSASESLVVTSSGRRLSMNVRSSLIGVSATSNRLAGGSWWSRMTLAGGNSRIRANAPSRASLRATLESIRLIERLG